MKLLALIIAYLISHLINKPERFRQFNWFKSWSDWFTGKTNFVHNELTVITIIALPVVAIYLILATIFNSVLGGLIMGILVLSYCIGPESIENDVASGDIRNKLGVRKNAKVAMLIKTMTRVSLQRWFGVFFWYIVLGVVGALLYRLSERLDFYSAKDSKLKPASTRVMQILNYPVAWMMVVALAIASDFERIYIKCKPYLKFDNMLQLDTAFLYEATDFAVENCELKPDNKDSIEVVTLSVLKRMLVVWLVIVAILVIIVI
ncbi:MAG: hypothetical protein L3J53_07530 [Proteobacteria bacterium]|nr:hypothetical protein [Pseudomonadota bacterium]